MRKPNIFIQNDIFWSIIIINSSNICTDARSRNGGSFVGVPRLPPTPPGGPEGRKRSFYFDPIFEDPLPVNFESAPFAKLNETPHPLVIVAKSIVSLPK